MNWLRQQQRVGLYSPRTQVQTEEEFRNEGKDENIERKTELRGS